MDEDLKKQIEALCQPIPNDNNHSEELLKDGSILQKIKKTMEDFNKEIMPNIESFIQHRDMDNTMNITAELSISFLNESRISTKTNKYLLIDGQNAELFNDVSCLQIDRKFEPKRMARFLELDKQNYYEKFENKLRKKLNLLNYHCSHYSNDFK